MPNSQRQGTVEDGDLGIPCTRLIRGAREVEDQARRITPEGRI